MTGQVEDDQIIFVVGVSVCGEQEQNPSHRFQALKVYGVNVHYYKFHTTIHKFRRSPVAKNFEICTCDGSSILPNQWMSQRKIDHQVFFRRPIRARAQCILEHAQSLRDSKDPKQKTQDEKEINNAPGIGTQKHLSIPEEELGNSRMTFELRLFRR